MKNFKYTIFAFFISLTISAQVGINTTSPDASSILDISATDKGLLIPRVSLTDVTNSSLDGVTMAATGLLIYNTNASITGGDGIGYYYFNGTLWEKVITSNSTISDNDFHEVGTTTAPDDISDDIFTQGAVAIGANTTNESKLNVNTNATENYNKGLSINMETGLSSGLFQSGLEVTMNTNPNTNGYNSTAIRVDNNADSGVKAGIESRVSSSGGTSGKWNLILSTSGDPSTTGNVTGIWNNVTTGGGSGTQFGIRQRLIDNTGTTTGNLLGFSSDVLNQGTGPSIGFQSQIQTNNGALAIAFDANHTGNSGGGSKYGLRSIINPTVGGNNHFGVYSEVLRTSSGNNYAGYFLGNVSIGTTNGNNYIFPASRGTANQIMLSDGVGNLSWVDASSIGGSDADFYEEGTTNAPDNINDDIYTLGNIALGKNTADVPLDIESAESTAINVLNNSTSSAESIILNFDNTAASANRLYGIKGEFSGNGNVPHEGIELLFNSSGTGGRVGVNNVMLGNSSGDIISIYNTISNSGNGSHYGVYSSLTGNGSGPKYGVYNRVSNTPGERYGVYSEITSTTNISSYGSYNEFTAFASGDIFGNYSEFSGGGVGNHYGNFTELSGTGSGQQMGSYALISNSGNGVHYGSFSELSGLGSGDKYGSYSLISPTAGGTHYGVYSEALKTGSFAGYFLGRLSIGTTNANNYILPNSRGTANQVMLSDAGGNLSWVNASSLGTTDADFYEEGSTSPADNINDDIYTLGNVAIGKNTADHALDISAVSGRTINTSINNSDNTDHYNMYNDTNNNGTGNTFSIRNEIGGNGNGNQTGILNLLNGTGSGSKTAITNSINANSSSNISGVLNNLTTTGSANITGTTNTITASGTGQMIGLQNAINANGTGFNFGVSNAISGAGNGDIEGMRNNISNSGDGVHHGVLSILSGTGSGSKYGLRSTISNTAGGNLYGVYSQVLRTTGNSYAGYFLGDVAIGTSTANIYTLPAFRGAANQVMQTDGAGNVSWVNPDALASIVNANNGLGLSGSNVQLGGVLNQNTIISNGASDLTFNLNGSGEFIVSDQGIPHFQVAATGISSFGDDTVWRDGNTSTATIIAQISDDVNDGRFILYENGFASVDLDSNTQFVFNEQGFDRNFRIESDGQTNMFLVDAGTNRIGIRENNPNTDIHLKQSTNTENGSGGMTFESSISTNTWKIFHSGSHLSFAEFGVRRAYIEAGTGNYIITSDERLKKDIEDLPSVLNSLEAIDLYKFRYQNQNTNDKKILGVMAQEVQQVFPELVSENENGNLGVSYDGLSVIALKAIKEQQAEIEQLKAQLEAQQKEIELIKQLLQEQ